MDYDSPRARRERQAAEEFAATDLGFAVNEARKYKLRAENWRDAAFMLAVFFAMCALFAWL